MMVGGSITRVRRAISLAAMLTIAVPHAAHSEVTVRQIDGAGGVPLNVAEAGQAGKPGILFIHGNGQSYLSWHKQLTSDLAEDFHLVAYDLRGHGNSGKPWDIESYNQACIWADDIDAVLQSTGLTKPIIVGWSRGGLIAMHYVRCRGTSGVSGIVMVASRGRLVTVPMPPGGSPAPQSQILLEAQDIEANVKGAALFTSLMTHAPADERWTAVATAMNIMAPPYARRAMRSPVFGPDGGQIKSYETLTSQINVPFLAVMGDKDPFRNSAEMGAAFQAAIPHAEVLIYTDVGHSPFLERPEAFNADLRSFAKKALSKAR